MVKRFFAVLLLLLAAAPYIWADNSISIDMSLYNTVMQTRDTTGEPYWAYGIAGTGALSFKSTGNSNVRADLALDFTYPDISGVPVISLRKAYVKAKFPSFKLTVGKTRLAWGDGFVFNSGDVIFGSITPDVNLIGSEVRTETAWLTSMNIPLGRFSFAEILVKAPDMIYDMTTGIPVGMGKLEDLGIGARVYSKIGGLKVDVGYYFDGTDHTYDIKFTDTVETINVEAFQRSYISLQGNIGPDVYLNGSLAIPVGAGDNMENIILDSLNFSFGLFHMIEIGYNNSMTLRLESIFFPYLNWGEEDGPAGSYAFYLYPELAFTIGQNWNLSLRSIFSPVDLSAMISGGFSWNVFQGFNLLGYANFNIGDGNDTFSWSKSTWIPGIDTVDGISILFGIQYIY